MFKTFFDDRCTLLVVPPGAYAQGPSDLSIYHVVPVNHPTQLPFRIDYIGPVSAGGIKCLVG